MPDRLSEQDSFFFTCPNQDALDAALAIRDQGGNAVDAVIAAAATLTVCYPHMTGLGGDVFAVVRDPAGDVWVLNGSGRAPAAVDREALFRKYGSEIPRWSPATITIPGAARAWSDLIKRFGNRDLAQGIAHAILLASRGIRVSAHLAEALEDDANRLIENPMIRATFFPSGRPLRSGDCLMQPQLASTLAMIAEQGVDVLYSGELGDALVAFLNEKASPIAKADLTNHRSTWSRPISHRYGEYELCTAPPNSQGRTLLKLMAEIERRGLVPDHLGDDASEIAEVFRWAMMDRDARRSRKTTAYGDAPSRSSLSSQELSPPYTHPKADTVGIVAADGDGWWIAFNQSLFDSFGVGIAEPLTGIVLHNRGASFSLAAGRAHSLRPGARPPHTLMPTLVLRAENHSPVAAVATMGGSAHPQIQAEVLMSLLRNGDVAAAIQRPRWLVGGTSRDDYSVCVAESSIPPKVRAALMDRFRAIDEPTPANGVGHAQAIARSGNRCIPAADFRSNGCTFPEVAGA